MENQNFRKGTWSSEEDSLLRNCIKVHGEGKWHLVSERAGLNRCRKSCRLRWINYLDPNINSEMFKEDEIELIIKMHRLLGNRWSQIARALPGRTANAIKNYCNTRLRKTLESQLKEEEEEEEEPNPTKGHKDTRPLPRFSTTTIATGGPLILLENRYHQLQREQPPPPPEQSEDPDIENNEHTIWWNDDTFNFLENSGVTNAGKPSTYAVIGGKEKETSIFHDRNVEWGKFLKLSCPMEHEKTIR